MKYLIKIYLLSSFLFVFNAYSDSILDPNNDIRPELRDIFNKVGIVIPAKDQLLDFLKKEFNGTPKFDDDQMEKIRKEFSTDLNIDEDKCAKIINDLYKIFSITKEGFMMPPEVDIAMSGTSGPDVMLQKMAKLKALEETGELQIKHFVFITNNHYKMMNRFRSIENLKKVMGAYGVEINESVVEKFLQENEGEFITHQQAFENIVMRGTNLGKFFEDRYSTFITQYTNTADKYQEYFASLAREAADKSQNFSIVAVENSFLQDNSERNKLIFGTLKKVKMDTITNNIQFSGMIVAGPIKDENGFIDIEKEMAAHLSSPQQTIVDLLGTTLKAVYNKNANKPYLQS